MDKSDLSIDIKKDHVGTKTAQVRAGHLDEKVSSQERIFLLASFIFEIPSAVFDQLSSVHRPHYALLNMLTSFAVLIISMADLVYKGRKARVTWTKKGLIPWFYHQHPNSKPFVGTFVDVIGLICTFFQWIFASIAYIYLSRHVDNPIKISIWPIIFALCIILYSRLSEKPLPRSTVHLRKLNRAEEFNLAELAAATNDFSDDNKIGEGWFGIVYRGQLPDGREVAIRRSSTSQLKDIEGENSTYEFALTYLLRLHHRNLVILVGYCEEEAERLLVFDYMKNGSLYNQLFLKDSCAIDSLFMRIKIALDAARGIDYLHNFAIPPLIHRFIESSCILLDVNWTARVADFGFAMVDSESEQEYQSKTAAERVGYVDPEFYALNVLTAKSDVYSFGVVLLELLTGKKAIFHDGDNDGKPTRLVDFAVPKILRNELVQVLDSRIGPPNCSNEAEAVEIVGYAAVHCVNSEGNNRPTMTNIVINLEQALSLVNDTKRVMIPGEVQSSPTGAGS